MSGNRKSTIPRHKVSPLSKLVRQLRIPSVVREHHPDGTVMFKKVGSNLPAPVRFPQKLWNIVHSCKSGAIGWTTDGDSIYINYNLFKNEFLVNQNTISSDSCQRTNFSSTLGSQLLDEVMTCSQSGASSASQASQNLSQASSSIFKTSQITSFIRQLNLYGFRKVAAICGQDEMLKCEYLDYDQALCLICSYNEAKPEIQIFANPFFVRGRHDLIDSIIRCTNPGDIKSRFPSRTLRKIKRSGNFHRPIKRMKNVKSDVCCNNDEEDNSWLDEELDRDLPDVDDDFIELLLSDNAKDIECGDGDSLGEGHKVVQCDNKIRSQESTTNTKRMVSSTSNQTGPMSPATPMIRTPFDLITIDDCLRLLDSSAHESWTSFHGDEPMVKVRQLPLDLVKDPEIPPMASVMMTSSDPFLSSNLFPELH